jgi:hypothetical protein
MLSATKLDGGPAEGGKVVMSGLSGSLWEMVSPWGVPV